MEEVLQEDEVDKIKEMLTPDEVQVFVNKMSNWQRTSWARDGYSILEDKLAHFIALKR